MCIRDSWKYCPARTFGGTVTRCAPRPGTFTVSEAPGPEFGGTWTRMSCAPPAGGGRGGVWDAGRGGRGGAALPPYSNSKVEPAYVPWGTVTRTVSPVGVRTVITLPGPADAGTRTVVLRRGAGAGAGAA